MSFSPLGSFNPNGPLNESAIAEAKIFLQRLPELPIGSLDHIYLHWTVGHYNQNFNDYNASVRYDGQHFYIDITHNPADNAVGVNNQPPAYHTWLRNTGGFGIATDDMVGAGVHNFGSESVTVSTLEYLCAAAAAVSIKYKIDLEGVTTISPYVGENPVMTHAIAAMTGGNPAPSAWYDYGITGTCERWDLSSFCALPIDISLTKAMAEECCNALRTKIRLYKININL